MIESTQYMHTDEPDGYLKIGVMNDGKVVRIDWADVWAIIQLEKTTVKDILVGAQKMANVAVPEFKGDEYDYVIEILEDFKKDSDHSEIYSETEVMHLMRRVVTRMLTRG